MKITLDIPEYDNNTGIKYSWVYGFNIEAFIKDDTINIVANKEGLLSLANHLLNLAQDAVPNGCHLHFDNMNSLNENSTEIIIEKNNFTLLQGTTF